MAVNPFHSSRFTKGATCISCCALPPPPVTPGVCAVPLARVPNIHFTEYYLTADQGQFADQAALEVVWNTVRDGCYAHARGSKTIGFSDPEVLPVSVSGSGGNVSATFPSYLGGDGWRLPSVVAVLGFSSAPGDTVAINISASTTAIAGATGSPTCDNGLVAIPSVDIFDAAGMGHVWGGFVFPGWCDEENGWIYTNGGSASGAPTDADGGSMPDLSGMSLIAVVSGVAFGQGVEFIVGSGSTLTVELSVSAEHLTLSPVFFNGFESNYESCPRLLLPPLTEQTGNWYEDLDAAMAALDFASSSCLGYYEGSVPAAMAGFSATPGSNSLTLSVLTVFQPLSCWASVNAEHGETLTITTSGGSLMSGFLYDSDGALLEEFALEPSPWTSASLPYSGRYTINIVDVSNEPPTPTSWPISAVVTSSGALSANPVQALYDVGAPCPDRLDC